MGWGFNTTDLAIYPALLGLDPPHSCYGSTLKVYVYPLPDKTRGVLHCQSGQWGLELGTILGSAPHVSFGPSPLQVDRGGRGGGARSPEAGSLENMPRNLR